MEKILKENFIIVEKEKKVILYYLFEKDVEYYLNLFGEHFIYFFYDDFIIKKFKLIYKIGVNIGVEITIYDNLTLKEIRMILLKNKKESFLEINKIHNEKEIMYFKKF